MKVRVRTRSSRLWLLSLLLVLGLVPMAMRAAAPEEKGSSALTPLVVDPNGYVDPMVVFQSWRKENRVTLPVPPFVLKAHEQWLRYQNNIQPSEGEALPEFGFAPESATVGTNECLQDQSSPTGVQGYQGEVTIAVNPNNGQQLVAGANTFYQDPTTACHSPTGGAASTYGTQALYASTDGGQTWNYNCAPWPSTLTGGVKGADEWFGSDPTVAWDASGNAYATYMLISANSITNSSGAAIVVAKSTNAGASWASLGTVVGNITSTSNMDDKEMMAIDITSGQTYSHTNRLYVIWDENNVERVAYSDNGTTWTTIVVDSAGGDIGGDLAIGPDGTVYAVWNRYSSTGGVGAGDKLVFAKSTNGGASWTSPAVVVTHNLASFGTNNTPPAQDKRGVNAFPAIAVDTNSGSANFRAIYVVYSDFPPSTGSGTDLNVYLTKSTDGGATWTGQLKVNDDAGTATQFFPWVAVDESTGSVNVSWYDTRNDTNNKKTQLFFAQSTNGGAGFSANQQVAQPSGQFSNTAVNYSDENSADNAAYNGNQYGDYAQIAAAGGKAWPIWTDSRQFYPTNGGGGQVEDAASAVLTFCTTPGVPTGLSASPASNTSITLTWSAGSPAGATYNVYRSSGACPGGTFTKVASGVAATSYTDSGLSSGTTYSYEVTGVDGTGGCESALSSCAAGTTTGPCGTPPTFGGLSSVVNPGNATCTLSLAWSPATSNCGGSVYYRVYRSTSGSFTPTHGLPPGGNQIAEGVTGTAFTDTAALANGTPYYYVVRAVDAATGVEDANTATKGAVPTAAVATNTLLTENWDGVTPPALPAGWATAQVVTGGTNGAWATHNGTNQPSGKAAHSGSNLVYFNSYTCSAGDETRLYRTSGFSLTGANSATLTFWMYHDTGYPSYADAVQVQVSTNGSTWTNIGSQIKRYDGSTGWKQVTEDLSSADGNGSVQIAFLGISAYGNDCHIDDVTVTDTVPGACATGSALGSVKPVPDGAWVTGTPMQASKVAADGSTANLTWDAATCTDASYNLLYGNGSQLSSYTPAGSVCALGNTGTASGVALPAVPGGETFLWWVLVGTDGASMESSWGRDSSGAERHPAASGQCGFTAKSTATSCP